MLSWWWGGGGGRQGSGVGFDTTSFPWRGEFDNQYGSGG